MPIHGLEWLFISLIVIILVLWDPEKIPKLARALAEAKKEYEKATSTMQELINMTQKELEETLDSDEKLIEIARELGIETYGKTRDEIKQEILRRKWEEESGKEKSAEKPAEQGAQPS